MYRKWSIIGLQARFFVQVFLLKQRRYLEGKYKRAEAIDMYPPSPASNSNHCPPIHWQHPVKIRDEITHIRLSLIRAFRIGNPSGAWAAEREKEIQSSLWRAYTICVARFHGTSVKREPQIASSSSSFFLSFTPWKEPTSRDLHRNEISRHVNTRRNVRVWESYVYILPIYKGQLILGLWGYSHRGLEFQKIEFIATGTLNLPVFVWEQRLGGNERNEWWRNLLRLTWFTICVA